MLPFIYMNVRSQPGGHVEMLTTYTYRNHVLQMSRDSRRDARLYGQSSITAV